MTKPNPAGIGEEESIYRQRFSDKEVALRETTWKVLCEQFLQNYVPAGARVVDIGAGDGLFLKNINARSKTAIDINADSLKLKDFGVEVINSVVSEALVGREGSFDIAFCSNFFEHLPDKSTFLEVLRDIRTLLADKGKLIVLQPNIRYTGVSYWDYIDHHIALTEHSLKEALEVTGYQVTEMTPRFLPYTVKSNVGGLASLLPQDKLVSTYLKFPVLWKFFGAQTFCVGEKCSSM